MRKLTTLPVVLFSLVAIVGSTSARAESATGATIAFTSDRDGNPEIYLMDVDGSNLQRVTDNSSNEHGIACSPDGRRIAFVSDREGNDEIYVMNMDGSELQRLTDNPADDYAPNWSRDGGKIAFTSERDGDREIFVMNNDGSGLQQLTHNTVVDNGPNWSPDGSSIVFHSDRSGFVDIWLMNADGSSPQNLTSNSAPDYLPDWSPSGSRIVFESSRHGPLELYTMNPDGSSVQRLTYTNSDNHFPDWSPDGSQIVFMSFQGNNYEVMVIGSDGTGQQNLTNHGALDANTAWRPEVIADSLNGGGTGILTYTHQPVSGPELHQIYTIRLDGTENLRAIDAGVGFNHQEWSPDGRRFACVGYVNSSTWSIFAFDADGTNLTRLTNTSGVWDNEPSWSPDGARIAWGRIYPAENHRAELWMMNADGTDKHPIGVAGDGPNWSPDGTRLVYQDALDVWTCTDDGGDERQLTDVTSNELMPDWSPDGSRIVFASDREGDYEIFVMETDGTNPRRLTNNDVDDYGPRWSPDGSLIAFSSGPSLAWDVYAMDSTGANVRRVTYSAPGITAINPDWQPTDPAVVPVYLTELSYTRNGASIRFTWEVGEAAIERDFRLLVGYGDTQRSIPVHATGRTSFEAVDDHPSLMAGGSVVYRLFVFGDDGRWELLRTKTVTIEMPGGGARILGVSPNPISPRTTISFAVDHPQRVRIDIHDATGRRVTTLAQSVYPTGDFQVSWDGQDAAGRELSSGLYFLRFQAGGLVESHKLVLLRD